MEAARHGHKLAVIQSEWLQGKNNEITRAVQAVVPYYQKWLRRSWPHSKRAGRTLNR